MARDFPDNTHNFFIEVYEVVKLVPRGRVTSYGAVAVYLGAKGSARMVGWAMNNASAYPDVPAHRVLNREGKLTAKDHFGGNTMAQRLKEEGVIVKNDRVQDFKKVFWDPSEELL